MRSSRPARLPAAVSGVVAAGLVAAALVLPAGAAASAAPAGGTLDPGLVLAGRALQPVVATGPAGPTALAQAVEAEGGRVGRLLPLVGGLSAAVPADALTDLAARPGVSAVTADRRGVVSSQAFDDSTSASAFAWSTGAAPSWPLSSGTGVGVAVLDTGVSAVPDLQGRLVSGPDLSGEGADQVDSHGHGTVMAGLVAGSGTAAGASPRTGVAPGAHVVSVKVAGRDGATDVSTVLAAMHWVASFREPYGIRVLSLSWGVPSTQDPAVDPLNHAVQRLTALGITVVVAAGNAGPGTGTVLKPADDPLVLTVGAYDDRGDVNTSNDALPAWTSRGPTAQGLAKPDLVAPGRSVVAVRAPGSQVELENPRALVAPAYVRGSGSSQATAVVAGAAAVLLGARPHLAPHQVKAALVRTAVALPGVDATGQGAGRLEVRGALAVHVADVATPTVTALGTGSLDASRGAVQRVQVRCGGTTKALDDETTAWCAPWEGQSWSGQSWSGQSWSGQSWSGQSWSGQSWSGQSWSGQSWSGQSRSGSGWTTVGDEEDTDFLASFWGQRPQWWQHVAGEESEPVPAVCLRRATCR